MNCPICMGKMEITEGTHYRCYMCGETILVENIKVANLLEVINNYEPENFKPRKEQDT